MRVLYSDASRRLMHLDGMYEGRGLPTLRGQLLLLIEFQHQDDPKGGTQVEVSITGHVRLDTPLVGTVAQLATTLARPAVERAVERKVRRFFETVARVSRWAHDQPQEFWAALDGHPEIRQDATLVAFREILLAGQPPGLGGRGVPRAPRGGAGAGARGGRAYIPMKSRAWSITSSVTVA